MDAINAPVILLVEDNLGEVRLVKEALGESEQPAHMEVARDGEDALQLLRRGAGARLPDPTILDPNLPTRDGREVVAEMRADPRLRSVPVVILSTSQADDDVNRSYELGADCHADKPVEFGGFIEVIRLLQKSRLKTVELPRRRTGESARCRSLAH